MEWFLTLVAMAGTVSPSAAILTQVLTGLDRKSIEERLRALEDPISHLHPKMPQLSQLLYDRLIDEWPDSARLDLKPEEYREFRHPLAELDAKGIIAGTHTLTGDRFVGGLRITDPAYLLYLQALFGELEPMEDLTRRIEGLDQGVRLNGRELQEEFPIPLLFIDALFEIYEAKGYGFTSKTIGRSQYIASA